jgi:hypothetical protein
MSRGRRSGDRRRAPSALVAVASTLLGCSALVEANGATYEAVQAPDAGLARSIDEALQEGDRLGTAFALWDDELIVSAPGADQTGVRSNGDATCGRVVDVDKAGRVFAFSLGTEAWAESAREIERDRADDKDGVANFLMVYDQPVTSLAHSGDLLAVGWPGMDYTACATGRDVEQVVNAGGMYLFERDGDGRFEQVAFLTTAHPTTDGLFGASVALAGGRLFVGAPGEDGPATDGHQPAQKGGRVYVFEGSGSEWSELTQLAPDNPITNAAFGNTLAADGDTVAVGALGDSHPERGVNPGPVVGLEALQSGAAYVFRDRGGRYAQEAYIKAENADANDSFGSTVALEGDTLVVSAVLEAAGTPLPHADAAALRETVDNEMIGAGALYVYRRSDDAWRFDAYLKAPEPQPGAAYGFALALRDGRLLVGAATEGNLESGTRSPQYDDSGGAYLYDSIAPDVVPRVFRPGASDRRGLYGYAVALGSRWVVVGGPDAGGGRGGVAVFEVER